MYANLLAKHVAKTDVASGPLAHAGRTVPVLDALATRDATGRKWRIALINRHPADQLDCVVTLGRKLLEGKYRATVLAGDSPEVYNDIEHPDRVVPQTINVTFTGGHTALPPHSLMIVEVE